MEIARPAASCTNSKFASDLRFASGREGGNLFVPNHHPVDAIVSADGVCKSVERVTGDSIDPFDPCSYEGFDDDICNLGQHLLSPHLRLDATLNCNGIAKLGLPSLSDPSFALLSVVSGYIAHDEIRN